MAFLVKGGYVDLAKRYRRHVLDALREATSSDAEFREEARIVLGLDAP